VGRAQRLHDSVAPARYRPPIDAPPVDRFRLPDGPYASGNRGWEYRGVMGAPVRAAGGGVVAFAGMIGGRRFVSIDHPDGLRTTYSWMARIGAHVGELVDRDTVVGVAGTVFHFGVLRGGAYVDPAMLFGHLHARLVCGSADVEGPPSRC